MTPSSLPELPDVCGPVLACPVCHSGYLHQGRVDVFHPRHEDAPDGLHVTVQHLQVAADPFLVGNPSPRRQGLTLAFVCENCCAQLVLSIVQHQGQTFLDWEDRHPAGSCGPECDRVPTTEEPQP